MRVLRQRLQQRAELDRLRRAAFVQAARVGQPFLHQPLHGIEVGLDAGAQGLIVHQLGAQAQAGDRGLQVVRDGGEDARAFGDVLGDALLHLIEGGRGLGDLGRATHVHRCAPGILAERARSLGHARQRAGGDAYRDPGEQADAGDQRGERSEQAPGLARHDRRLRRDARQAHLQRSAVGERHHDQQPGVGAVVARMGIQGGGALRHCLAQRRLQRMIAGERTQVVARRAQCEAQAAAADLVDPAFALGRRHALEQVGGGGDLLRHAFEERAAADALALADEERQAHREHQRDADHPDQHQAGEQAARQWQSHERSSGRAASRAAPVWSPPGPPGPPGSSLASAVTSAAST